ncbi:ribonuclease H-like domain-containing protein, partial [Tanacetum coccineum]
VLTKPKLNVLTVIEGAILPGNVEQQELRYNVLLSKMDWDLLGLDDSVYRPTANKTSASVSQVVTSNTPPSNTSIEMLELICLAYKLVFNTGGWAKSAVCTVKENGVTAVKTSAGCVWRPKQTDLKNGSKDNSGSWISKRGTKPYLLTIKILMEVLLPLVDSTRGGQGTGYGEFCGAKRVKKGNIVLARYSTNNNTSCERKNRTLIEAARTMLADSLLPTVFWAEAVNTACYGKDLTGFLYDFLTNFYELSTVTAGEFKLTKLQDTKETMAIQIVLDKMMDQEKEATEQSDAVRKEFDAQTFSPVGPSSGPSFVPFGGSFLIDVANLPYDPLMPELEDTVEIQSTSIFGNAYDDHDMETLNTPYADQSVGAEADFNNMESSTVIIPIPTTRVHSIHPKA